MAIRKSIFLFLVDGTADGIVAAELSNWTGKGYKILSSRPKDLSNRQDLKKAGIYFLFVRDEYEVISKQLTATRDLLKKEPIEALER